MQKSFGYLSCGLLMLPALIGCGEEDGNDRPKEYGPVQFEALGAYSAYMVQSPGSKPEQIPAKTESPTGLGGRVDVPRCHRWGVCVFVNFGLEGLSKELTDSNCPEVLVYDWDSGGGSFSDEDLLRFARIPSVRRLDLQLCKGLSEDIVTAICGHDNLEELLLPSTGDIGGDTLDSLRSNHPSLDIVVGPEPRGQTVGQRIETAISAGR